MIGIITNPVNSTVPIAAEVLMREGVYDPRKLFGVTSLDVIRAETFAARAMKARAGSLTVPVIGGHSGTTILPLFSQVVGQHFSLAELAALTSHVQEAGTEVVNAKAGSGSATLAMAQAALRFCLSLVHARQGEPGIIEYAYVEGGVRTPVSLPRLCALVLRALKRCWISAISAPKSRRDWRRCYLPCAAR